MKIQLIIITMALSGYLSSQVSLNFQTNQGIETSYTNRIVAFEDGYFLIESTYPYPNPGTKDLLLSRYNHCHEEIWSKKYQSNTDLTIDDALINDDQLVILAGSGMKYPIIIFLDLDGNTQQCYDYQYSTFDNHHNLACYNDSYHFFGPSDGASHYVINSSGEILYANNLTTSLSTAQLSSNIKFGSTILSNGLVIRRYGNILAGIDSNQKVQWAKQISTPNRLVYFSERKPTEVNNGFVLLGKTEATTLFKIDYDGNLVWTISEMDIESSTCEVKYQAGVIHIVSHTKSLEEKRLAYITVDENTGTMLSSQYFEFEQFNDILFPCLELSTQGDVLLSGSIQISFSDGEWEDIFLINPHLSSCHEVFELPPLGESEILFEDVTQAIGVEAIEVTVSEHNISVSDYPSIFANQCEAVDEIYVTEILNCDNKEYVFDNQWPGSSYLWSDGSTDSIRTFASPQTITALVSNCLMKNEFILTIEQEEEECSCEIYLPNIINTNSERQINKNFTVQSTCTFEVFELDIYDRWGNKIYTSTAFDESWNGKLNGRDALQGVYVYQLKYSTDLSEDLKYSHGTITVAH